MSHISPNTQGKGTVMHNRMPILIAFTIACVLVFALFFLKNNHQQISQAHYNGLESIVNTGRPTPRRAPDKPEKTPRKHPRDKTPPRPNFYT